MPKTFWKFGAIMTVVIHDVAKQLNLSITTVSRALDGYDDVAEHTRELVIKTAQEMGYSPNRAARQLRRQRAETIGFILPANAQRFDEPFFAEFIAGLGNALAGKKFDLLLSKAQTTEQERDLYQRWINSRKVDGFILNRICRKDWRAKMLDAAKISYAALGRSQDAVDYPCIRIDGAKAYRELVEHLVAHGFKQLSFIGGPLELINHIDRLQWFKAAIKKAGLQFDPGLVISADMTSKGGYTAANQLLARSAPPDAILCVNDQTAFGVLHAAQERNLRVGEDIAIAGFDGLEDSQYTIPPLTSLHISVYDIAQQLFEMLWMTMNGEPLQKRQINVQPELLIRQSTGG
jgi:LacI family transcriptional regulator